MGWNLFFDLACTVLLGPAFVWWMGDARPVARVTADCACKVCDCSEPCPCPPGAVAKPAMTRVLYCSDAACPAGQQACCPVPAPRMTSTARPAGQEMTYQVHVRLVGDSAGPRCSTTCPMVTLPPNTYSLVTVSDDKGQPGRSMHLQVQPVDGRTVRLNMKLSLPGKKGEPMQRMACTREVRLNTVTGVVLEGDGPEPCVAEVRVHAHRGAPVTAPTPPAPAVCPAPRRPVFRAAQAMPVPPPPPVIPNPVAAPSVVPNTAVTPITFYAPPATSTPVMPPPMPTVPVPMPVAMPEPLPTPTLVPPALPAPAIRLVNATSVNRTTSVSLIAAAKGEKSQLHWKHADGSVSRCVRLEREMGTGGAVTFAAGKKYVHIQGEAWKATADKVEVHDDGFLVLTGHVKVVCEKGGKASTLAADRVAMKVRSGKIDKVLGGMTMPR